MFKKQYIKLILQWVTVSNAEIIAFPYSICSNIKVSFHKSDVKGSDNVYKLTVSNNGT